jgi:peroxiredoxin Q/BCP
MRQRNWLGLAIGLVALAPAMLPAQDSSSVVKVGDEAPDFTLPVSTRDSNWKIPARLRDFRGQTVVLAFFYKVRTGG